MSDAPVQTQPGLEAQRPAPVRRLQNFIYCPHRVRSPEVVRTQPASLDDAFECADGNGFVAVDRHDHLPAVGMTPFLMAAFLADRHKSMPAKDSDNFPGVANWKALAHGSAISSTFAPAGTETDDGSNQSSKASFALAMASSSESPAEAQPGSSGKKAAQRWVSASCSTTSRSFMVETIPSRGVAGKEAGHMILPSCATHSQPTGSKEVEPSTQAPSTSQHSID